MNQPGALLVEETLADGPYQPQARLFKLLTHPARLAIIDILRGGERCVCHMEAHLGYRQAYLSQQLAVLRQAGLIVDRRDGWNIYYSVVDTRLFTVLDAVNELAGRVSQHGRMGQPPCPCPHCAGKKNLEFKQP